MILLSPEQKELRDFMSDISETSYCAGWMRDTEYRLWSFTVDPLDDGDWGRMPIPTSARQALQSLSARVDGWICYVSDDAIPKENWGATFVPMPVWLAMYEPYAAKLARVRASRTSKPRRYLDYGELFRQFTGRKD